jgi:hypothetical protein
MCDKHSVPLNCCGMACYACTACFEEWINNPDSKGSAFLYGFDESIFQQATELQRK